MTEVVAAGYDAVYAAWASSAEFHEIWARHAVDGSVAAGYEHLNFADLRQLERMRDALELRGGDRLVDLACGAGGPSGWIAQQSDACLVGVDLSRVGARLATERASVLGLAGGGFVVASVDQAPIVTSCVDAVMSVDSLQYVPDKRAAFAEVARVMHGGGRFVFTAFEVDPERVRGVPILGMDPIADYSVVLAEVGFVVDTYEETPGWHDRLVATYSAVLDSDAELRPEMGEDAMDALALEMSLTLQIDPYPRRVFVVARSREDNERTALDR